MIEPSYAFAHRSQHKRNWHFAVIKLRRLKLRMQGFQAKTIFLGLYDFSISGFYHFRFSGIYWRPELMQFLESTWKKISFQYVLIRVLILSHLKPHRSVHTDERAYERRYNTSPVSQTTQCLVATIHQRCEVDILLVPR